jgi:hypothetical protein
LFIDHEDLRTHIKSIAASANAMKKLKQNSKNPLRIKGFSFFFHKIEIFSVVASKFSKQIATNKLFLPF